MNFLDTFRFCQSFEYESLDNFRRQKNPCRNEVSVLIVVVVAAFVYVVQILVVYV